MLMWCACCATVRGKLDRGREGGRGRGSTRERARVSWIYSALTGVDDFEDEAVELDVGADVQIFRRVMFRHFVGEKRLVGLLYL